MIRTLLILSCASLGALAADAGAVPAGWFVAGKHPEHYLVETVEKGACGARAASVRSGEATPAGNIAVMQMFRAEKYRGLRVRFTAKVATKDLVGWAGLWMRVEGPQKKTTAFDNMQARPLRGTVPCAVQSVVLDVGSDAELISLGLVLDGPGSAELAHPELEVVDQSVATTDLVRAPQDPRLDAAVGRVAAVWFSDRIINSQESQAQLKLVTPGQWRDRSGDFTASVEGDTVRVTAVDYSMPAPRLAGEFKLRREGDANVIEGTWGTALKQYPVTIKFSKKAVDMKWGFYERHLVVEKAPQLAENCVFYAQWASASRLSDELQLCGAVFDPDAPRAQTVLAFLLGGFRRMGTGIPLDPPATAPRLPGVNEAGPGR